MSDQGECTEYPWERVKPYWVQEQEDRERYWNSAEGRAEAARQQQQRIDQEEHSKRRSIERVVEEALDRKQERHR